jgi:hypothetical protein
MKYILMLLCIITANVSHAQNNIQQDTTRKAAYYCPMHPEIVSNKPGTCTKCGMKLVKKKAYTCSMHPEIILDKPGKCPGCGMDLIEKKQ